MATITGTFTGTASNGHASVKITIAGRTYELASGPMSASDNKTRYPVNAAVVEAVLAGVTTGTITVTAS